MTLTDSRGTGFSSPHVRCDRAEHGEDEADRGGGGRDRCHLEGTRQDEADGSQDLKHADALDWTSNRSIVSRSSAWSHGGRAVTIGAWCSLRSHRRGVHWCRSAKRCSRLWPPGSSRSSSPNAKRHHWPPPSPGLPPDLADGANQGGAHALKGLPGTWRTHAVLR